MELLDAFLSSVDPLFDWESFITPPALEEVLKEATILSTARERQCTEKKTIQMMVTKTILQRKKLKGNHPNTSHLP